MLAITLYGGIIKIVQPTRLTEKEKNMKRIETKKGLKTLLERYLQAGVTDETMDASNSYPAKWISTIKGCISS